MNEIAIKNDLCRRTFADCKVFMTVGVAHSPHRNEIIKSVREFYEFTRSNDPYGEHDFGNFEVHGQKYFFKFDYFDDDYKYFKEDGNRVLTIMRADEY